MISKLVKEQYWTIIFLSTLALIFAALWLSDEIRGASVLGFNLEPLVVSLASAVPIVTLFWPFRPKFRSKRITDTITIDGSVRKVAEMGEGDYKFIVSMSPASNTRAYIYVEDPIMAGAFVAAENRFEEIKNAGAYTLSKETQCPNRGDVVVLKNRYGNYCVMMFEKIEAKNWEDATRDVWTIRYMINPTGGVNFG